MRGGRFQQRAIEDASTRNAEALFETRTVVEIREVENRTRKDIEEKKEELRQLVGASYRDLIESADSILDMRRSCEAVSENIARMESGFETLQKSIAAVAPAPGREESRQRREKLFGLGSRVKYLVDTPEKIWGCLDEHLYLEGAERYMRAREVHSLLAAARGPDREMLAAFPLLKHQWPLVETFRSQIAARSRDRLLEPGLKISDYAVALSATAIIDDLNSSQVFALFLECRRSWLKAQLRGPSLRGATAVDAAASFGRIVSMIKTSLCHMGELFYEVSAGKPPMLFGTVLTAPPPSQLFGGIPSPDAEVELWKKHRERLETLMIPLSVTHIKDAAQEWLEACKEDVATDGKVLLDQVKSAQGLAEIERSIRAEVARNDSFAESMEWLAAAFGVSPDAPWDCVCDLLVKEPVDLWKAVFEKLFVERTKAIVDAAFAKLSIRPQVEKYLAEVVPPPAQEGVVTNRRVITRSPDGDLSWKSPVPGKRTSDGGIATAPLVLPRGTGLGPEVAELRDLVDERLAEVLRDALPMLRSADGAVNRTADLAPYIQERCFSAVSSMVEGLEARLGELSGGPASGTDEQARVVEQALLIGRFCAAMWQSSKLLPVILGPPAIWSGVANPGAGVPGQPGLLSPSASFRDVEEMSPMIKRAGLGARRRTLARRGSDLVGSHRHDLGTARLRDLQRTLRRVSVGAHRVWVDFSTRQLAAAFAHDLREEDSLRTAVPLKGWEETVIKEVEDGKEVDMHMHLPAMPSQFAVLLLYAACREVHRVGSHTLDRAVLRQFSWSLSEKVLETFDEFLGDAPAFDRAVSEKGVLQLLFDLRFLADALSGGADVAPETLDVDDDDGAAAAPPSTPGPAKRGGRAAHQSDSALVARRRRITGLLELLWTRLDPIDWATYEQYLWQNEARHYNRCAVLFGALIQLNRLYTDVPKPPYNADTNTLNMSATCPRFSYLPISAPMLNTSNGSGAARFGSLGSYDGRDGSTWQSMSRNGDGFKYSFTETKEKGSLANNPILKSFMGQVGGKIGESVGSKLGSMLSEGQVGRLKDKSAQVVSTFGDMLPVQASSLFSSFTAVAGSAKVDT